MVSVKQLVAAMALNVLAVSATAVRADAGVAATSPQAEQVHVFFCDRKHWAGECKNFYVQSGTCNNMPEGWDNRARGIRNNQRKTFKCTWFLDANCRGKEYTNQWDEDLTDGNGRFDMSISSLSCQYK